MKQAEKLATGKGQTLLVGIAEKIEARAIEIFGKK
jgi:hypothetical protein